MKTTHAATLTALCLVLTACSGGTGNSRIDYNEVEPAALEVPPDLTTPANTGLEEIPEVGAGVTDGIQVLPRGAEIHVQRDGAERWLLIDISAEKLWPRLRDFWPAVGLKLEQDNPRLGIMETAWAENRADAPKGLIASTVKSVFKDAYSADTRDKYRLRLEPRKGGRVELFLTHYGLQEVISTQPEKIGQTVWQLRPSDPELANEVMNRLVLFLGGSEKTAKRVLSVSKEPASQTRLEGDTLIVDEGFARTWRLTGIALDRLGLVVDDRNRSEGLYYVSKINLLEGGDGSWLSGVFGAEESGQGKALARQIRLRADGGTTRISVRDSSGNPDHGKVAKAILQRLQEALK